MFWAKVGEKIETHILYLVSFFSENRAICMYVILKALQQQQWLCDRASVLRFYVHYLSCNIFLPYRTLTALKWSFTFMFSLSCSLRFSSTPRATCPVSCDLPSLLSFIIFTNLITQYPRIMHIFHGLSRRPHTVPVSLGWLTDFDRSLCDRHVCVTLLRVRLRRRWPSVAMAFPCLTD